MAQETQKIREEVALMELHSPEGENESMKRLCASVRDREKKSVCACVRVSERAEVCWSAPVVQSLSGSGRSNAGENESLYMSLRAVREML